jgi:hypothetical protein
MAVYHLPGKLEASEGKSHPNRKKAIHLHLEEG